MAECRSRNLSCQFCILRAANQKNPFLSVGGGEEKRKFDAKKEEEGPPEGDKNWSKKNSCFFPS